MDQQPFLGTPDAYFHPEAALQDSALIAYRVGQLEAENAWLRRRVRRYNRGSWALGLLLVLVGVLQVIANSIPPA